MLPALLARWSRERGGRGPDDWSASLRVNYPLKRFLLLCCWQVGRRFTWSEDVSRQHQEEGKENRGRGCAYEKYCVFLRPLFFMSFKRGGCASVALKPKTLVCNHLFKHVRNGKANGCLWLSVYSCDVQKQIEADHYKKQKEFHFEWHDLQPFLQKCR